jgi:hypothetical protein
MAKPALPALTLRQAGHQIGYLQLSLNTYGNKFFRYRGKSKVI